MALLTTIDGIPLYTTIQEAVGWASNSGLIGYHEHIYKEQLGYMGGIDHATAIVGPATPTPTPPPMPMPTPTPASTTTTTTTTTGSTGYSGGGSTGGGGGY